MRILFLAAFILALAGCASGGPTIENAQLAELQKGKTTVDDVVRRFGKPSFNSDNLDGTRTTAYLQEGTRSSPSAMLALVAAIASGTGSTVSVNSIIFRFDAKGVLSGYERTSESPGAGMTASTAGSTAGAGLPAAATTAGATPAGTAASSAETTRATAPKPAPRRADGLPDWLPNSNYDPRNPF